MPTALLQQTAGTPARDHRVLRQHPEPGRVPGPDAGCLPPEDGREPRTARLVERQRRQRRADAREAARRQRVSGRRNRVAGFTGAQRQIRKMPVFFAEMKRARLCRLPEAAAVPAARGGRAQRPGCLRSRREAVAAFAASAGCARRRLRRTRRSTRASTNPTATAPASWLRADLAALGAASGHRRRRALLHRRREADQRPDGSPRRRRLRRTPHRHRRLARRPRPRWARSITSRPRPPSSPRSS